MKDLKYVEESIADFQNNQKSEDELGKVYHNAYISALLSQIKEHKGVRNLNKQEDIDDTMRKAELAKIRNYLLGNTVEATKAKAEQDACYYILN